MKRAGRKNRTSAKLVSSIARVTAEQLEQRRLLDAQVIPPSQISWEGTGPLPPNPGTTFWINGNGRSSAWSFNSAITPNTVNDLVLNVTPFSQTYTGCCEGTNAPPGNTGSVNAARLLTNGITQNQVGNFPSTGQTAATGSGAISDASSGASVVSQSSGSYWMEYNLGAWPGGTPASTGYDINEIDVISGNQDYRTGMQVDILVQLNGDSTDWFSLSNGHNFSFTSDPSTNPTTPPQLSRGAAQMAIANNAGGPMATNIRAVKFLAVNHEAWFRELVITGNPSGGEEGTSPPSSVAASPDVSNPGAVDLTFDLAQNSSPSPYLIQRAMVNNDAVGGFTTIGTLFTERSPTTFVDTEATGGTVYVYRIVRVSGAGPATSPLSNFITTPTIGVEAHFYNQAFWSGPVAASEGLVLASIDSPTGAWPGTASTQDSLVLTGKVTTNHSGVYTFMSNTDDDGYLYVDGVLVSSDPAGHSLRNAGQTMDVNGVYQGTFHPILLAANTQYDFVLLEHHASDATAGAHMFWVTPSNPSTMLVPASNLSPVSDPPAAPTALTPVTVNSSFVNFTFTAENRGVVEYLLQRREVTGGAINQPWVTVGENYPASDKTAVNSAGVITSITPAQVTIQDAMPIAGSSYIYRVAAVNYDGTILSPETPATVVTAADLASPPTPGVTLSTPADASGLSPGTYFLSYTWTNSSYLLNGKNRGQTAGSAEQTIVLKATADILAALPVAPAGAINANVYLSTATAAERLVGSVNGGQTLTINSLPPTAAKAVPTTNTAGLAPGTYFVAYTWLGDNLNATGETQDQAIDNTLRITLNDETSIVLSTPGDVLISGFPQVPASAQNVHVYVGTASGQENLVATIAPTATLTLNTLSTPTNIPLPASDTTASLSAATSPIAIPPQSTDPPGVEIRMYNGVLTDTQLATQYVVAMNGVPAEYDAQVTDQGFSTFFPGVIDQFYEAAFSDGIFRVFQSPDFTPFPDIPRIEWDQFTQVYTGSLQVGVSGVYTIVSNTDDSGFVWVNGMLVSADPGKHTPQDTTSTRPGDTLVPVTLLPGQSYNLTMTMTLAADDGLPQSTLKWIEPAVNTGSVALATNNNGFGFAAVTLNSASFPAGINLTGFTLFITGGTGSGQQAVVENWNSTTHEAIVQVTSNGSNFLWGTVPDSTSQYSVAWQEVIPLANSGNNGDPTPGAGSDGFLMRQDVPVESSFNPATGDVGITSSGSAAGNLAITGIDPRAGITLTWTDQSNSELWFEVHWTTVGKSPFDVGTNFTDPTAGNAFGNPTISYFYRVRGVNFDGAGPFTSVVSSPNLINGTTVADQITLRQDPDHEHIDWILNGVSSPATQVAINDPLGLTINGNGGNDAITLDYSNGNPLPATLHLNGVFFLNGLQGTNPLAGTVLDINRSTLFISYSSSDPIAAIQSYLKNGYNNGAWNGMPAAGTGVITSLAAQANANHTTAIGYADWTDGQGIDTMPNTIELKYTLIGDANLDTNVNSADLQILLFGLNRPGAWDQGDFNYDGQVNSADLQAILFTLNTSLGSQAAATPVSISAASTNPVAPPAQQTSTRVSTPHPVPSVQATAPQQPAPHPHRSPKTARKKR